MPEENEVTTERNSDRRKRPTPFLSRYTFKGRRTGQRREQEKYNYYVDRIGIRAWIIIGVISTLSVIDSIFTIYFLRKGFIEVNPLMNIAIITGKPIFLLSKYALTVAGILVLALHKNFWFVKELITLILVMYLLLNTYHIWLFTN